MVFIPTFYTGLPSGRQTKQHIVKSPYNLCHNRKAAEASHTVAVFKRSCTFVRSPVQRPKRKKRKGERSKVFSHHSIRGEVKRESRVLLKALRQLSATSQIHKRERPAFTRCLRSEHGTLCTHRRIKVVFRLPPSGKMAAAPIKGHFFFFCHFHWRWSEGTGESASALCGISVGLRR